ncbi:hypothetical protein M408DRAFT_332159 [Serendipita vermifera MAFF 305830]|uniref:DNA repair and recombination protein RAD54B n=1 Tax=Serendipita vermifera MAFF 305830 TaxID=933852 RepID=A0A0C2X2V8_SERVB|nr:hypothetical protein M408DRAFT_332159 [Serendipita vermifera MAFF 305830]
MASFTPLVILPAKRKAGDEEDSATFPHKRKSLDPQSSRASYWTVQWRNPQAKKHKTWEGDGVVKLEGERYYLFNIDGKPLGEGKHTLGRALQPDDEIHVGGKDVSIESSMPAIQFEAGTCFGGNFVVATPAPVVAPKIVTSKFKFAGLRKPSGPLQVSNNYATAGPSSSRQPQLNALANRQYPASKHHVQVTDLFEDEGVPAGDVHIKRGPAKQAPTEPIPETLWTVNWRKSGGTKKNKVWEGDGLLHQRENIIRFLSDNGIKELGSKSYDTALEVGRMVWIGSKEMQVDAQVPLSRLASHNSQGVNDPSDEAPPIEATPITSIMRKFTAPAIVKQVARQETIQPKAKGTAPLFDPEAPNAIVMKRPSTSHQQRFNPKNRPIVPVVLDPLLASKLRPHQIEGVKFMYECVMGMSKHEGHGDILGDEMGLGKTLQTIALVWTLLKQNQYAGDGPVIGKAMVVCPVSLVENWRKEFHKWIGRDRIGIFSGDCDKATIKQFQNSRIHQVLIIGYERLRGVIDDLAFCHPPIGLVICDEGHRLKSAGNKTTKMFQSLKTLRRIILSGTPIQNDLSEFHAMADFCNPNLLDDYGTFKRVYETPIVTSRAPDCSSKARELGSTRAAQLQLIAKSFVLRREASILSNYLPPKYEYVVFVSPTQLQLSIMGKLLHPDNLYAFASSTAKSLALIGLLSKICNSPVLLRKNGEESTEPGMRSALALLPPKSSPEDVSLSGKLTALANILMELRKNTDEKCIIVSHYTSTLNIIESFCNKQRYTLFRLDGQTPPAKRQEYVDIFNKCSQNERFLFLLSAKAGGVGLNLIGASRLVLVDGDWNPSHDLQAMARIHRDGQKRTVFIYRLLTAGTIDEKIYQRQITKMGLSEAMMGAGAANSKSKTDSFTSKELRDLFNVYPYVACHTHELLGCSCEAKGATSEHASPPRRKFVQPDSQEEEEEEEEEMGFISATQVDVSKLSKAEMRKRREALSSLAQWTHINCMKPTAKHRIQDTVLRGLLHPSQGDANADLNGTDEEALDDGSEQDMTSRMPELNVRDVPGGTVTFTFERFSANS